MFSVVALVIVAINSVERESASYKAGWATGTESESASYKAGWATGVQWAQGILENYGASGVPDAEIAGMCPRMANFAENDQTYYYPGGQIAGVEINHDDFTNGCVQGARSAKH
jgi:hypothetical protein